MLSYGFWQREYGGSPSAIGRTITLDGHAFDIVGVTPASFFGVEVGRAFDVAVPLCAEPFSRGARSPRLDEEGRLVSRRDGPSEAGRRRSTRRGRSSAAISPPIFQATLPSYRPEDAKHYLQFRLRRLSGRHRHLAAARGSTNRRSGCCWRRPALVLLIACANLANLMLARATAREREIAVRLAIGASRGRIVRQLLAESLLIAAIGAAAGALARAVAQPLHGRLPDDREQPHLRRRSRSTGASSPSPRCLACVTCLIFGLVPAIRATGTAPGAAMKAGSRGSTDTRERFGMRRALVVAQVALSLVLVVGALLFVRSLRNLMTLDAGFSAGRHSRRRTSICAAPACRTSALRLAVRRPHDRARGAARASASAAQAFIVPVSGSGWNDNIVDRRQEVRRRTSTSTRSAPAISGRWARRCWPGAISTRRDRPGARKVGDRHRAVRAHVLRRPGSDRPGVPARPAARTSRGTLNRIVGVVKDTKYTDLREEFTPLVFFAVGAGGEADPFLRVLMRSPAPLRRR